MGLFSKSSLLVYFALRSQRVGRGFKSHHLHQEINKLRLLESPGDRFLLCTVSEISREEGCWFLIIILVMAFPATSYGADYLYLDKKGTVKGRAIDDGDSVRFYDKSFNPRGLYDRDTNTTFDKNNNPTGTIHDFDEDDD